MNTHQNKAFTLMVWGLCIIALCLGGFFLYHILSRDAEARGLAIDAREAARKNEQLSSVRTALRESSDTLSEIEAAFIPEGSISSFIDSLETLASDRGLGLSIGSIGVEPVPNISSSKQLRVRVSTVGSWSDVVSFIATIESLSKAVSVQKSSMSRDLSPVEGKSAGQTRWSVVLEISALVLSHQK